MANSVTYDTGSIRVQDPKRNNVVVYAHPKDRINLGFDVSSLRKEVVNGDLVIKTLSGGSVTIANYSIMFMQNQTPMILDSLSKEYSYYDFLDSATAHSSFDDPDAVIVTRTISTPRTTVTGDYLASGHEYLTSHDNMRKLVGLIDVDEQHPILAQDVSLNPFMLLRLYPEGTQKYDATITYRYNGRTILNQEEPNTLPVVTRTTNPKSNPIYGTKETFSSPAVGVSQYQVVDTIAGGGNLIGNDYSTFMYDPQTLQYTAMGGSVLYRAYNGNQIVRGLDLYLTDMNATFSNVLIQDVPAGITFKSTETTEVQPLGNGTFYIIPKSQSQSINLYFTYNEANAKDSYGHSIGMQDIMKQVKVSIEGYNAKYKQIVTGSTEVTLDFKQVHGENDVNNFSLYNTYTYSTTFDPLIVTLTHFDDYIIGGVVNHIYNTLDGNDTFKSGIGNEKVYLGEGDDTYIYNWGNDFADGKATIDNINNPQMSGVDRIRFDHDAYINSLGHYTFNQDIKIVFNKGEVNVYNNAVNPRGDIDKSFSTFKHFDEIYLEEETGVSANSNNSITINSTEGFDGFKIYSGGSNGGAGDTLYLTSSSLVDFNDLVGAFVSTKATRTQVREINDFDIKQKIYFSVYSSGGVKDIFNTIYGSNGDDYVMFSDSKNFNITFYGQGGTDTLDFSLISGGVTYDANSGEANYGTSVDTLKLDNGIFIGSEFNDVIHGSGNGSMTYYGHAIGSTASDKDIVTYENWKGPTGSGGQGVVIDYIVGKLQGYVQVSKYGRGIDKLYSISEIKASQADDIFKLSYGNSYVIDGLEGNDTMDYSADVSAVSITLNVNNVASNGATGDVAKGANQDTFSNINGIIGTKGNDIFYIKGSQASAMSYDGGGGTDTINYSGVTSGITISFNLTKSTLVKRTSTGDYLDKVVGFKSLVATSGNDEFIAEDSSWQTGDQSVYEGGGSTYDPSQNITEKPDGTLNNAGDVLFLNYDAGYIPLSSIETRFKSFDTLRLGNHNNSIVYADTTFKAIWGSTNHSVINTFDASAASNNVNFNIQGNTVSVGALSIKIYNFNVLKGSSSGSTFFVKLDNNNISNNYDFQGGQSLLDVLDYTGTTVDLKFNLGSQSENDVGTVTKGTTSNQDKFSNIESFIGGSGNDTFILNPYNTTYKVDGGAGINTVSFENYFASITSSNIDYSSFTNIQKFELTNFDDNWLILASSKDSNVSGGRGIDTITIDSKITSVTYTVGTNIVLNVSSSSGSYTHKLDSFEILNGTDVASNKDSTDKVIMNATDNTDLSDNDNLYFILNKGDINYSSLSIGVTLNIFGSARVIPGVNSTMSITKANGTMDYYSGVAKVVLTEKDDIIHLDLTVPDSFANMSIDAGGGVNTIDVSNISFPVIYDSTGADATLNGSKVSITNWSVLKTGDGDDIFKLKASEKGLTINAGFGNDTLDLSNFSNDLVYNFTENTDKFEVVGVVLTTSIEKIVSGSGNDTFNGVSFSSYKIDGGAGNNTLDYTNSQSSAGFSFHLSDKDNSYIKKGLGGTDYISNIQIIKGTKSDDTFSLDSASSVTSIDGGAGRNELFVGAASGSTSGFNFDLDHNTLTGGGFTQTIKLFNFQVLHGSKFDDTFTVTSGDVLSLKGEIWGGGGNDTLNAKIKDSSGNSVGLYVDLANGYLYKNNNNTPVTDQYLLIQNITHINLGDGDDVILFSGALTSGNYVIDLGGGNNLISFETVNYALSGTFDEILKQVTGGNSFNITGNYGLKLTNFADTLKVLQTDKPLVVDGGDGIDTINYAAVTDDIEIVFSTTKAENISVKRGSNTDNVKNFEKFILGSGANTIIVGQTVGIDVDLGSGTKNKILSYEQVEGGVIANLDRGTIYKQSSKSLDRAVNLNIFKDSKGDDIVYASNKMKEIWGSAGNDVLNLEKMTVEGNGGIAYLNTGTNSSGVYSFTASKDPSVGTKIFSILTTATSHTYNRIVFGNYNVYVATDSIEGRSYYATLGKNNFISYAGFTGKITVDFIRGLVSETGNTSSKVDTIANFTTVYGTNHGDNFQGLNASSNITLNLGKGDDVVSFTGSTSALDVTIDATGQISTGNVKVNKGSEGNLTIGATRFNDIFHISDMAVLNVNRGIDGAEGINTLDFSLIHNNITFTIGDIYKYKFYNIQSYVFTDHGDNISWVYDPTKTLYIPKTIDFGAGDDVFNITVDHISGADMIYMFTNDSASNLLSIKGGDYSSVVTLVNLEKLALKTDNSTTLKSFRGVFDGYTYTGNIFSSQIDLGNVSFTDGIAFEYKNYKITSFDTSTIIKDVTRLSFLGSANPTLNVLLNAPTASGQNRNVVINIADSVNFTVGAVDSVKNFTLQDTTFIIGFKDSTYTQNFYLNKIYDSTLTINSANSGAFVVNSNFTIEMFKKVAIDKSKGAHIDFSGYSGQHGNLSTNTDWVFNNNKLTGRFSNDFEIDFSGGGAVQTLTATNDVLQINTDKSALATIAFDGGGGTNTIVIKEGTDNLAVIGSNFIAMATSGTQIVAGSGSTDGMTWSYMTNFQIMNAGAANASGKRTNADIINIFVGSQSLWTTIIAPNAGKAVADKNTMPRVIFNPSGFSTDGTTANVQGGFSTGGNFVVNFDYETGSTTVMNRMMNVTATLDNKIFNVQNVQSIYGRRGESDHVVFAPIDTNQFSSIIDQFNLNPAPNPAGNERNVARRANYLYLDLEFGRDETSTIANNNSGTSSSKKDTIDFSSWKIHNSNHKYADFKIEGSVGDSNTNGLHMFSVGDFDESNQGSIRTMMMIKADGNQNFILPQTRFYWGATSDYFRKYYTLQFPQVSSKDYYSIYDNFVGNYSQGMQSSGTVFDLFVDSTGLTHVGTYINLINFTTFYFDRNAHSPSLPQDQVANIGAVGKDVFLSNKVFMYFDQKGSAGYSPINLARSNNADVTSGSGSADKANFAPIASGNYYFSWGSWQMQEALARDSNYIGFQSTNQNVNGKATAEYNNYITNDNTGVGIVFTQLVEKDKVGSTDGYSSSLFYRMQGVNQLSLTSANDTFALGKIFWSDKGPSGAFVDYNTKTFLNSVDAGTGVNTLLDNTFSSDTKQNSGAAQAGKGRQIFLTYWHQGGDTSLDLLGAANITDGRPENGGTNGAQTGIVPESGHIERFYFYDDHSTNSPLYLRNLAVIDSTYGNIKLQDITAKAYATLDNQKQQDTGFTYVSNASRATYYNFNKLEIDDYSATHEIRDHYYTGVRDIVSVKAKQHSSYREFDLGGRYFINQNSGNMLAETVQHATFKPSSGSSQVRIQWMNVNDSKIDSSIIVQDGWDGTNYTSYYSYRNWDSMVLDASGGATSSQHLKITYVFNTDFDFNKMNSKVFTLDATTSEYTDYSMFFQEGKYNYHVTATNKVVNTINCVDFVVSSKDDANVHFTFRIFSKKISDMNYKPDAADSDIQSFNLTPDQIYNLETYGNIEGVNKGGESSSSTSTYAPSDSFSSYGSSPLNHQQEEADKSYAFSTGEGGVSSFGRLSSKASKDNADASSKKASAGDSSKHQENNSSNHSQDDASNHNDNKNTDSNKEASSSKQDSEQENNKHNNVDQHANSQDDVNNHNDNKNTDSNKEDNSSKQDSEQENNKHNNADQHANSQDDVNNHNDNKNTDSNKEDNSSKQDSEQENNKHNNTDQHANSQDDNSKENNIDSNINHHLHDDKQSEMQDNHNLDNLQDKDSFDGLHNNVNDENNHQNIDFANFSHQHSDVDLLQLFDSAHDLLVHNENLSDSLSEMIHSASSIEEEAVSNTNQHDELDSMSFALDSMFNVDENHNHTEVSSDNNKHKNSSSFSNS